MQSWLSGGGEMEGIEDYKIVDGEDGDYCDVICKMFG